MKLIGHGGLNHFENTEGGPFSHFSRFFTL
jgi:hypothetical protein